LTILLNSIIRDAGSRVARARQKDPLRLCPFQDRLAHCATRTMGDDCLEWAPKKHFAVILAWLPVFYETLGWEIEVSDVPEFCSRVMYQYQNPETGVVRWRPDFLNVDKMLMRLVYNHNPHGMKPLEALALIDNDMSNVLLSRPETWRRAWKGMVLWAGSPGPGPNLASAFTGVYTDYLLRDAQIEEEAERKRRGKVDPVGASQTH
jgi:hypothetical protein